MHSRKKGKSGSTKSPRRTKPSWVRYSIKETEQLIIKLAKGKKNLSDIGMILRDTYGVPDVKVLTKKSINKILKENDLLPKLPNDLVALIKKDIALTKHLESNKKDEVAKRGQQLTESKIKRISKYYKRKKILPENWKFNRADARLLIG